MQPLVSIITPCFNQGQYLEEAIESIKKIQTPYLFEYIIVNDGSTDDLTIRKLEELSTKGFSVIHQKNTGLPEARNRAIQKAKGKYIVPLDADNKLHTNYLTKAIDILEESNKIDIVYGNATFFEEESKLYRPGNFDFELILKENYIDACAVYRKTVWEKTGGYDKNMLMGHEDWEFWLNCFFKGAIFFYFNENCFYYRVRNNSMLTTIARPAFNINKSYILKKYADEIFEYYSRKMEEWNYMKSYYKTHRFKTAANLIFKGKI